MKKIIFLILTLLLAVNIFAQNEPSKYMAVASQFKKFYNSDMPDSIFNNFSPEMKADLPEEKFKATTIQLKSQIGPLLKTEFIKYDKPLAEYKATFQNAVFMLHISINSKDQFTGLVFTPYVDQPKNNDTALDPSLIESPVLVKTLAGPLSGTLTMPKNPAGKIPVVLIIGAESADRNGNSQKHGLATNDYKLMAEALGKSNIATVRYDKRMVGESMNNLKEADLRFDDHIDDAISLINLLKADTRFSKIIVLGHGDGALIGMVASTASEGSVNAYISVEGTADQADKILTDQMKSHPQYLADEFKVVMDSLRHGKVQKNVDPALYFIARPSIQYYTMSWCRYEPQKEIKKLKIPALILQGATDLDLSADNADKLKKNKNATVVIIPGMNHVLKEAPPDKEKNLATYNQPDLPLKPELITSMVSFVNGLK